MRWASCTCCVAAAQPEPKPQPTGCEAAGAQAQLPGVYVVKKGDDLSFLPIDGSDRKLDYSRFDIGGEPNELEAGALKAFLFSDRGLYRPGDTIQPTGIVKSKQTTANSRWVLIDVMVRNQNDEKVATGEAMVEFPR